MIVDGLKTNVLTMGQGKDAVVLLHGWGGSSFSMLGLGNDLCAKYKVIIPDLWGFGKSEDPPHTFDVFDYALCVVKVIKQLNLKQVHIIGHSFGGRLGIIIASLYPQYLKKLVLIDSAGLKSKFSIIKYLKIKRYKHIKKQVLLGKKDKKCLSRFGSKDFLSLNNTLKEVFVRVVNQHLNNLLKDITAKTLILWGKKDKDTPLYMAKVLHKNIKSSKLKLLNGGHFAYLFRQDLALSYIYNFLED